ncbi:hypothetical protein EYC84_006875 [Monilinia fructicola]|uniref:Uncharacterized protein n=1 Tax=Monilinia fructicola TaxID=38448 RepID=A0A5M9K7I7_MONFR|nr:hypothetical protein EYC84_006875 [Monilinia fructicola]
MAFLLFLYQECISIPERWSFAYFTNHFPSSIKYYSAALNIFPTPSKRQSTECEIRGPPQLDALERAATVNSYLIEPSRAKNTLPSNQPYLTRNAFMKPLMTSCRDLRRFRK